MIRSMSCDRACAAPGRAHRIGCWQPHGVKRSGASHHRAAADPCPAPGKRLQPRLDPARPGWQVGQAGVLGVTSRNSELLPLVTPRGGRSPGKPAGRPVSCSLTSGGGGILKRFHRKARDDRKPKLRGRAGAGRAPKAPAGWVQPGGAGHFEWAGAVRAVRSGKIGDAVFAACYSMPRAGPGAGAAQPESKAFRLTIFPRTGVPDVGIYAPSFAISGRW